MPSATHTEEHSRWDSLPHHSSLRNLPGRCIARLPEYSARTNPQPPLPRPCHSGTSLLPRPRRSPSPRSSPVASSIHPHHRCLTAPRRYTRIDGPTDRRRRPDRCSYHEQSRMQCGGLGNGRRWKRHRCCRASNAQRCRRSRLDKGSCSKPWRYCRIRGL